MRLFLLFIPLGILVLAWAFGLANIWRTSIAFLAWLTFCLLGALAFLAYGTFQNDPMEMLWNLFAALGCILAIWLGPWIALAFGLNSKQPRQYPAKRAYKTYKGLTPDEKEKVHVFARGLAKFGARHLSAHFERKGRPGASGMLKDLEEKL